MTIWLTSFTVPGIGSEGYLWEGRGGEGRGGEERRGEERRGEVFFGEPSYNSYTEHSWVGEFSSNLCANSSC